MTVEEQTPVAKRELTFYSGKLGARGSRRSTIMTALIAGGVLIWRGSLTFQPPGDTIGSIALLVFLACIPYLTIGETWIVEVNSTARRLRIFKVFKLRETTIVLWRTLLEDCSFDECSEISVGESSDDDGVYYWLSLDFKRGGTHGIPVQGTSISAAISLAMELATMTGIPRKEYELPAIRALDPYRSPLNLSAPGPD